MKLAIITTSDTRTIEQDEAGHALAAQIELRGWFLAQHIVVTDELTDIKAALIYATDNLKVDVILSCGGTGLGPRDLTPEATLSVAHRQVPGIAEAIRQLSLEITRRSMLSRALAAQRNTSLIINLPGSKKAALECFEIVADQLEHAVEMMAGKGH